MEIYPNIEAHQCFHAVGHGTFFTATFISKDTNQSVLSIVYDCGSKRKNKIREAINNLKKDLTISPPRHIIFEPYFLPEKIDLLIISHFDDDHVNGIEQLLQTRSVHYLVLPFMDIANKLYQAASISTPKLSISTALFQLDPIKWLKSRNLSKKVDSILYIGHSNNKSISENELEAINLPLVPENTEKNKIYNLNDAQVFYYPLVNEKTNNRGIKIKFFNQKLPNFFTKTPQGELVTKRSKKPITELEKEINKTINYYHLTHPSKPPAQGWRSALRQIYCYHFGNSSKNRNDISLCVLLNIQDLQQNFVYPHTRENSKLRIFNTMDMYLNKYKYHKEIGTLLLGDLTLNTEQCNSMKVHFGDLWKSILITQVPHHGSKNSWKNGNAAIIASDCFVYCAPNKSQNHPHEDVKKDIRETGAYDFQADYNNKFYIYHMTYI